MARRKRVSRRRSFTIPLAVVGGLAASPAIQGAIKNTLNGNFNQALTDMGALTGFYNGSFSFNRLIKHTGPIILGLIVHKAMSMLGVNRMLARARIPLIRI